MEFSLEKLSEEDLQKVLSWRYPNEYAVYNYDEELLKKTTGTILDPAVRKKEFGSIYCGEELVGHFRLRKSEFYCVLGMGMAPEACGKGYSGSVLKLIIQLAMDRYYGDTLLLTVRPFNKRAIRAYQKAGFSVTGKRVIPTPSGDTTFLTMELPLL